MSDINAIDAKLLLAFIAVMEERNVTRAATRMHVTQQGLSGTLQRLRYLFDDPLFVRDARGVVPTPRAEAVYPRVQAVVQSLRDLMETEPFDPATADATLRVAAADYALSTIVLPLFDRLRVLASGVRIAVEPLRIEAIAEQMRQGHVDLAFTIRDFVPDNLYVETLFHDCYFCAVRKSHAFATAKVTLDDFCAADHLLVSPNRSDFYGPTDAALDAVGRHRRVGLVIPSFAVALDIIETTNLLAVLPGRLLRRAKDRLHVFQPPIDIKGFDVVTVWSERVRSDPLNLWFREISRLLLGDR